MVGTVKDLTAGTWDRAVGEPGLTVVDFWAPWCPWCMRLMPVYEKLARDYGAKLAFAKVNVDEEPALARRFGVQGLPTLKFFCEGRSVMEIVGYLPEAALKRKLEEALNRFRECIEKSTPMKQAA